tara:strand:+ start:297 stop:926 length:630 start_codon:yes stop_codon:yes gene_type:complete
MTFNSVYEITNNLSTIAGQHMIEYFTGNSLDSKRWDTTLANSGTVAMSDTVNGGVILSTGTTTSSSAYIDFADVKPFGATSSMIWTAIHSHSANGESYTGLTAGSSGGSADDQITSYVNTGWKSSNFDLFTYGGGAGTWTNGTIAGLTSKHTQKLELTGTAGNSYVDGVLNCSSTTNLPTASMQVVIGLNNNTTINKTINVTYCEAWNT